jgi:hypothetical protein
VDPVPDPLLFSGSAGNRTRASGSLAKKNQLTVFQNFHRDDANEDDYDDNDKNNLNNLRNLRYL